jgi:hypothetical protein
MLCPSNEEGRTAVLKDLTQRSCPTFELFIYAVLSGAILAVGFLLDSQAVLIFGILSAPVLTSWVGLSIATVTGSLRFFAKTFVALLTSSIIIFLIGLAAGVAELPFEPRPHKEIRSYSSLSWPGLIVLTFGTILLVVTFIRIKNKPYLPSVVLAYAFYLPISSAGFGFGAKIEDVWSQALFVAVAQFSWATLVGILTLSIMRFRPHSLGGFSFSRLIILLVIFANLITWRALRQDTPNIMGMAAPLHAPDVKQFSLPALRSLFPKPNPNPSITYIPESLTAIPSTVTETAIEHPAEIFTPSITIQSTPISAGIDSPSNQVFISTLPSIPTLPEIQLTQTITVAPPLPYETGLDPVNWMKWPVLPIITQHVSEIYALGQSLNNDPHAFSIFGDCQSVPDIFLGPYIADPTKYASLPVSLQETVDYFDASLTRESATSKAGTTSGALLWSEWHKNKYGCTASETPMDCELRIHKPSFVLIMVGTHWEGSRNEFYMRKILDTLLEHGVIPILATKADNRESDNSINLQTVTLAAEYNVPLWNFWVVPANLPNRGLYTKKIDQRLGDIYLTEEALELHRFSALQVLDIIRRTVTEN